MCKEKIETEHLACLKCSVFACNTIGKYNFPIVLQSLRSNGCTQFYYRKIGAEQIYGKQTRKDKISTNVKAFRFVPNVLLQFTANLQECEL